MLQPYTVSYKPGFYKWFPDVPALSTAHVCFGPWQVFVTAFLTNQRQLRAGCWTSGNCTITIPFPGMFMCMPQPKIEMNFVEGTGITVFVAQGYAPLNSSITLDSSPPALLTLSQPTDIMYHVPFYAIQALPLIQHILEIRLNSWDDRSATSYLLLDYVGVAYNDEVPSPTTTSSSTSSSESQSIMPSSR